jgi:hypothetical protein
MRLRMVVPCTRNETEKRSANALSSCQCKLGNLGLCCRDMQVSRWFLDWHTRCMFCVSIQEKVCRLLDGFLFSIFDACAT